MVFCFGYDVYFFYVVVVDKVVDIVFVSGCVQCGVNVVDGDVQCLSFFLIDIDFKLWCIFQIVRVYVGQYVRMLCYYVKQLVMCLGQFFVVQIVLVNQFEVKVGCGIQFNDSWQVKGEDYCIFNL